MHERRIGGRPGISVVIPTTCEKGRTDVIWRAIHSVQSQDDVDVKIIVVVNGGSVYDELYKGLCAENELTVVYQQVGSLPAAQRYGRRLVRNEYFTLLDDDDELLPDALKIRAEVLEIDDSVDIAISNGYFTYDGIHDKPLAQDFELARRDPLLALMKENWLASCGGLFRTSTISTEFFDGKTKYHEWTLLAVKVLLASKKVAFIDQPTFRKHEELANSLSKSEAYRDSSIDFLTTLLAFDMPPAVKAELKKKIWRELHFCSEQFRRRGDVKEAWKYHIQSIIHPQNWKYLLYTRKLLIPRWMVARSK